MKCGYKRVGHETLWFIYLESHGNSSKQKNAKTRAKIKGEIGMKYLERSGHDIIEIRWRFENEMVTRRALKKLSMWEVK